MATLASPSSYYIALHTHKSFFCRITIADWLVPLCKGACVAPLGGGATAQMPAKRLPPHTCHCCGVKQKAKTTMSRRWYRHPDNLELHEEFHIRIFSRAPPGGGFSTREDAVSSQHYCSTCSREWKGHLASGGLPAARLKWARQLQAACEQAGVDWASVAQGQMAVASPAAADPAQQPDQLGAAASSGIALADGRCKEAAAPPRAAGGSRARSRSRSGSPGQGRRQRGGGSDRRGIREHAGRVVSRPRGKKHDHGKREGRENNGSKTSRAANAPVVPGAMNSSAPTRSKCGIAAVTRRQAQGCS
jgi:hypothetical protein